MAITGQVRRRRIVINADAYISGATSNVPVLVKFNSTSHPDLFATGDDKDSVWFSSDAGGQTTLYHEGVVFDATDAIFYVKVDLSSTADTVIYFWYGQPSITGTEAKTSVWTNALLVAHYQSDATTTVGTSGTAGAGASTTTSGLVGGGYSLGTTNGYVYHGDEENANSITVLTWCKIADTSSNFTGIVDKFVGSTSGYMLDIPSASNGYVRFLIYSGAGKSATSTTRVDDDAWHLVVGTFSGTVVSVYVDSGSPATTNYTGSITLNTHNVYIGGDGISSLYASNKVFDNLWIFTDAKSANFIKAVYNNAVTAGFITIDGAVNIGSSPKMICPVWLTNQQLSESVGLSTTSSISVDSDEFTSESSELLWDLNIIKGDTTYNLKDLNIIQTFDFNASYNRKSHTITIRLLNGGDYYNVFHKGNEIELYIYNDENNKKEIFNGMITSVKYNLSNYDESYILIRGEDKGSIRLKQKLITGNREFINKTVPEIITDIIETYTPDVTTTQVYSDTEELPYKSFTWITVADALDELAKLVNGYYYVDVNNDLVFKLYEDTKPKHEISKNRIITAQFGEDYEDTFDRVYVLGGKENILENDFADEDVVSNINCIDYYYAVKVTTSAVNINKISVVCAKVGLPRYNLGFSIIADKNGEPLGQVMGTGSIDTWDIGETPDWVDSGVLNIPLITDTFWIVFNLYTNEDEYFVLYHDNATANGHYRSTDIETWATQTGALAVKTYYGVQIVSTRTGTKQLNDYYSELLVTDENIETIEMGERTAEQKLIEKIGQNSSSLTVIPNIRPIMPAEEIRLNIGDVLNDEQVITNVTYSIDDNKVLFIELECIKAIDFYTAFADLYNAMKKINIKNTVSRGGKNIEYIGQQETFDEPIEDINIYERDATSDDEALGDDDFIFGVFSW